MRWHHHATVAVSVILLTVVSIVWSELAVLGSVRTVLECLKVLVLDKWLRMIETVLRQSLWLGLLTVPLVVELAIIVGSRIAVSYTHLDVYKRQAFM